MAPNWDTPPCVAPPSAMILATTLATKLATATLATTLANWISHFFKIGYMGHFFFKFKSGGLKTQRFSMFSATGPVPNLAAQKKLAFCRRETPIHFARPATA